MLILGRRPGQSIVISDIRSNVMVTLKEVDLSSATVRVRYARGKKYELKLLSGGRAEITGLRDAQDRAANVSLVLASSRKGFARIGIDAPREIKVNREEILSGRNIFGRAIGKKHTFNVESKT